MADKAATEAELEDALHRIALLEESNMSDSINRSNEAAAGSVSTTLQIQSLQEKLRSTQEEMYQADAGKSCIYIVCCVWKG